MVTGSLIYLGGYAVADLAVAVPDGQLLLAALVTGAVALLSFLIANTIGPILGTYATELWFRNHQRSHQALMTENERLRQQNVRLQAVTETASELITDLRSENALLLERSLRAELALKFLTPEHERSAQLRQLPRPRTDCGSPPLDWVI